MMPRGSGEYHRISPRATAIGHQPLAYADQSGSTAIMPAAIVVNRRPALVCRLSFVVCRLPWTMDRALSAKHQYRAVPVGGNVSTRRRATHTEPASFRSPENGGMHSRCRMEGG